MLLFSPVIEQAVELAAQWHAGTHRKGTWRPAPFSFGDSGKPPIPVIAHTASVAMILLRDGWDDFTVAAAFLHDVLEDPNAEGRWMAYEELRELVGPEIAGLVRHVSEPLEVPDGKPITWEYRKETYIAGIPGMPEAARAICLADKTHNLWTMNQSMASGEAIFTTGPGRRGLSRGPELQHWFYSSVRRAMSRMLTPRLQNLYDLLSTELNRFEQMLPTE